MWESPVGYVQIIVMKLPASYAKFRGATSAIGNSISFLFIRAHFLDRVALTLDVPTLLDSVRSECELSTCGTVGSDRLKSLVSLLRTSCSTSSGSVGASEVKHPVPDGSDKRIMFFFGH